MYIDYDNCLVSLISSIEKHYGLDTSHSSLTALDKLLDHSYKISYCFYLTEWEHPS